MYVNLIKNVKKIGKQPPLKLKSVTLTNHCQVTASLSDSVAAFVTAPVASGCGPRCEVPRAGFGPKERGVCGIGYTLQQTKIKNLFV